MKFDIFFAICQTEVDGILPSERVMFDNFFDQIRLADELGFGTAWVAETHLSCQVQKRNPGAVIPHFTGEIGLNTDILQLAHKVFAMTERIHIGSAIRNILCNGGPIAHAEALRTFLTYHGMDKAERRVIDIGFATGRFPFSNVPYGIVPRNAVEQAAWPVVRGKLFLEATEIFLRFLRGDVFCAKDVRPRTLSRADFRSDEDWRKVQAAHGSHADVIELAPFWNFDYVGVIPFDAPLQNLRLTIGSQDAVAQDYANTFMPVGVFNLSITPPRVIEDTHQRMARTYHPSGGPWRREYMPRTVLIHINNDPRLGEAERNAKARAEAVKAQENYWKAVENTLDPAKVANAVDNALVGSPAAIAAQIRERFHPEDRLMCWFDFNNHDNAAVKNAMQEFATQVAPRFRDART